MMKYKVVAEIPFYKAQYIMGHHRGKKLLSVKQKYYWGEHMDLTLYVIVLAKMTSIKMMNGTVRRE